MKVKNLNLVYISIQYVNLNLIKIFKLSKKKLYIEICKIFKYLYFKNLKKALL